MLSNKFKCALVTGGAGFIGSHLVDKLLLEGLEVIVIDNLITGKKENLESNFNNDKFHFYELDVLDKKGVEEIYKKYSIDLVYNVMASKKTVCLKSPQLDAETNAIGTLNMLELARDYGVKKFVHSSTGSVYGEGKIFPQTEEHPLNPTSYYGVSKLAGEKYVSVFNHIYGLDTTVLRYFHVYGPKQDAGEFGGVIAIFSKKINSGLPITVFGDGKQERTFTYVSDVVNANIFVSLNKDTKGEIYNVSSGKSTTLEFMIEYLQKIIGKKVDINYKDWVLGDIKIFNISNKKISDLGFNFKYSLEEGLKTTIDYFK
jgi:UDP-glucose 4-epimerase